MKRVPGVLLVIAFVLCINNLSAAGDKAGAFNFSFMGGISKPVQPSMFSDNFNIGYELGGQFGYTFNSNITLLPVVLEYQSSSVKSDVVGNDFEGNLGSLSITPTLLLSVNNEENVNPFFLFGLGLYHLKYDHKEQGTKISVSENDFGFNVGGGLEFTLGETTSLLTTAKYHYILTEGERAGYFVFNIGLNFYLLGK